MRRGARLIVVLLTAVALGACSSQPAAPASVPTHLLAGQPMTACLVQGEVPVKAEVLGVCGTLKVPEDRSNPGGRQIGLRVAVVPALAAVPAPDPFFAIAGGPGDASTQFFAWLPGLMLESTPRTTSCSSISVERARRTRSPCRRRPIRLRCPHPGPTRVCQRG